MPETTQRDPYRNFNFRIKVDNKTIAACRKMSALDATVNTVKFRHGSDPSPVGRYMPGRVEYQPVTLEAGVSTESAILEKWANGLLYNGFDAEADPRSNDNEYRKDVTIEVMDLDNKTVARKYVLHAAWPSKFTAMSDLAGDGNDVIIETLELTHEGFTREDT